MFGNTVFTRVVIITAIVSVACLGIAAAIGFATGGILPRQLGRTGTSIDERRSLPSAGVQLVSIDTVSDSVRIVEGQGDEISAWLHGTASATSPDAVPHLSADLRGSTADIRLERKRLLSFGFSWNDLVLEVSVPRGYKGNLAVRSVSADVDVAPHQYAGIALITTSGSMRTEALTAGNFYAHTTSGDLTAAAITAERSDISSTSGEIRVKSLTGDLKAGSVSGSMEITFAAVPGRLDAESTSGDVTIHLPSEPSFTLDAHSTSGDVTCTFPIAVSGSRSGGGNHSLAGTVGSGTGRFTVRTVSGSIRIEP
jgi:lia operon protein LiaG